MGLDRLSITVASLEATVDFHEPGSGDICFRDDGPLDEAAAHLARHDLEIIEGLVERPRPKARSVSRSTSAIPTATCSNSSRPIPDTGGVPIRFGSRTGIRTDESAMSDVYYYCYLCLIIIRCRGEVADFSGTLGLRR